MGMTFPDAGPDHRRAFAAKDAHARQRQEKATHANSRQDIAQSRIGVGLQLAEETHRQVHLLRGHPANAANARVQSGQPLARRRRQFQGDEKTLHYSPNYVTGTAWPSPGPAGTKRGKKVASTRW